MVRSHKITFFGSSTYVHYFRKRKGNCLSYLVLPIIYVFSKPVLIAFSLLKIQLLLLVKKIRKEKERTHARTSRPRKLIANTFHTLGDCSRSAATATSGNLHLSGHCGCTGILDQQMGNSQCKSGMDKFHPKPIYHWSNHKLLATATTVTESGCFGGEFGRKSDGNVRGHNIGD